MHISSKTLDKVLLKVEKPARYIGNELNSVVKKGTEDVRFAFCFPDTYEVGMSFLGMKILYSLLNSRDYIWCERCFAPLPDMQEQMKNNNIPLYGLESKDSLDEFDIVGFTLQYELSFTNVLNMLDLAGIPLRSADRGDEYPLIVGGGPCACNPEPVADFFDLFMLGEGEEHIVELCDLYRQCKKNGISKKDFLIKAAQIGGIYVPSLYDVEYNNDNTVHAITAKCGAPAVVKKRIIENLDEVYYPQNFIVPFIDTVHDRAIVEVMRGCVRGCRFCQAGFIYRPLREKKPDTLDKNALDICASSGYDELSLLSLSTSDYEGLEKLLKSLVKWTNDKKINVALPSLRIDNFSKELLEIVNNVRKSGLTFAPEAGTQRLRDVINKNVTEEEVMKSCTIAFENGHTSVKLYFMMGLPTETLDDIAGIAEISQKVVDLFYSLPNKPKGKGVSVSSSASVFVPKPFTPFQWEPQDTIENVVAKQKHLISQVKTKKVSLSWHDSKTSFLEAVIARGDRKISKVIELAYNKGCLFDGWGEYFKFDRWIEAMQECGIDPAFYANRKRSFDEILPWDHLDFGVSKEFLIREAKQAYAAAVTPNCRQKCSGCGANSLMNEGGNCCCGKN